MHLDETAETPSVDEIAIILCFLPPKEIMRARICTVWRDAAKKALVPMTPFVVDSVRSYNAVRAMSTALPNLQELSLHTIFAGDEKEPPAAITTDIIGILSNFTKLRKLTIRRRSRMTSFSDVRRNYVHVQSITISFLRNLRCEIGVSRIGLNLEMFGRLPLLKELCCVGLKSLEGSLWDLICLKDTLQKLRLEQCYNVRGNFMDLARFPLLKELDLYETAVTGDIRDIGEHDFPALQSLSLPNTVHGGRHYEFQQVDEVPAFMHIIHHLLQRSPTMFKQYELLSAFDWHLSRHSPDWYATDHVFGSAPSPPFNLKLFQAGPFLGWSWCTLDRMHCCEINWLDPLPTDGSNDYEAYMEELHRDIERRVDFDFFRGYHSPPTEMEFRDLSAAAEAELDAAERDAAERDAAETFFSEWLHHLMDY